MSKSETNPKFKFRNPKLLFLVLVICILNICACFEFRASKLPLSLAYFLYPLTERFFKSNPIFIC
jgi:hypothetical protein